MYSGARMATKNNRRRPTHKNKVYFTHTTVQGAAHSLGDNSNSTHAVVSPTRFPGVEATVKYHSTLGNNFSATERTRDRSSVRMFFPVRTQRNQAPHHLNQCVCFLVSIT